MSSNPVAVLTGAASGIGDVALPLLVRDGYRVVARAILKGIRSKQKAIYPSLIFQAVFKLNRIFPIFKSIAVAIEKRSFQRWVEKHG